MEPELLSMSQKEIDRLEIIQRIEGKQISQAEGAKQLGLDVRQTRRLQERYRRYGAAGLISKRRGQPSNNQLSAACKQQAVALIKQHYPDFNPAFAHEKLIEIHQLKLSSESVRQLMIKEGLWKGKKRKKIVIHQTRVRRSCLGEMIQIDGSHHDWFEGRRGSCCLLVFIDDATSKIMHLYFDEEETTEGYFRATEHYLLEHGRPLSCYSDKYGVFRINHAEAVSGTGETQFGRALRELGIELLCANSPQAKGRVERANSTLQNRLVKEMRLKGISDITAANAFLSEFIKDYNKRFAVEPHNTTDAHQKTIPDADTLKRILSEHYQRKISKNLQVSYNNVLYQIQADTPSYTMRGAGVTVIDQKDKVLLIYKEKSLPYKAMDKNNRPIEIADAKKIAAKKRYHPKPPECPWLSSAASLRQSAAP